MAHSNLISPEEQKFYISEIESFFYGINSMKSHFIEINSKKGIASGVFMIMKPYMMKVEYRSPHKNVIVADGKNLYHRNSQLNELSKYDITSSPIAAILSKTINLKKDSIIKSIKQDSARVWISLTLKPYPTSIVLVFTKNPFCLSQWIIINGRNETTEVTLQNIDLKAQFTPADFKIQ
ncbi:MAG: outer membrane lipoprotein carrier protein LolA [Holosporales bacterium]|nr:outer membrane lipoprotein carrier protein LolA [Holosporales bacterium]